MKYLSLFVLAALAAMQARAAYSPAGTVLFTDLKVIAAHVESLDRSKSDLLLSDTLPKKIRGQGAAQLFGPMRRGAPGVAVCYVDSQLIAKLSAGRKPSDAELERAKRWAVLYPATIDRATFLRRHPNALKEKNGTLRIPPGPHSRRTLWAYWSPDGQWASLAASANMATQDSSLAAQMDKTNAAMPSEVMRMTSIVVAVGPILAVYPFVQKYFIRGVLVGSIKG
jgi:hypothetical protein